jgi:hypothetical protein
MLLRKRTDQGGTVEYPIDPEQLAQVLAPEAPEASIDTGILSPNTVLVRQKGVKRIVVGVRPPQMTGLYLDGTAEPLRVPLPGLLMVRSVSDVTRPNYRIYAVKTRPRTMDVRLYKAPLPNIYDSGDICWGNVERVSAAAAGSTSLVEDWTMLLGSGFNDHGADGKSRLFPDDVRKLFFLLEQQGRTAYPISDLLPDGTRTLGKLLETF